MILTVSLITASCEVDDDTQVDDGDAPIPGPAADSGAGASTGGAGDWEDTNPDVREPPVVEPPAPNTGRFIVNEDGTALEPRSGLIWQQQHAEKPMSWQMAREVCTALDLNGQGYHLPTMQELQSIQEMEFGWYSAARPDVFYNTPAGWFWSSSVGARELEAPASAGRLSFAANASPDSQQYLSDFRAEAFVRCVRPAQPPAPRFQTQADGTVHDSQSTLIWQPMRADLSISRLCTTTSCTQLQALQTCQQISVRGSGMRLPTRLEVASLIDARFSPAVEPAFFAGALKPIWAGLWTSDMETPQVIAPKAYQVSLFSLGVGPEYTDGFGEVVCVSR